ncbi:MAG: B3/B4 domain-containing protein [Candidatus Thorarchaeota archaeon]
MEPFDSDPTDSNLSFHVDRENLIVSVTRLSNVTIKSSIEDFESFEQDLFKEIRTGVTLDDAKDDPIFRSYRDLYWTFGMDPTKHRVSSEALFRRVLRELNFWRVSNLVDVANLASAYHKIPIGLVDDSQRNGDIVIRTAQQGEVFTRIGGQKITCRGREIVLADQEKIICYGYATHDSEFTKVTPQTKDVLLILYGAPVITHNVMNQATCTTIDMITKWVECTVHQTRVYATVS